MACKVNFWKRQGMQTTSTPQNPTTPGAKEFQKRLDDLKTERSKLDTIWTNNEQVCDDTEKNPLLQTQRPSFFQQTNLKFSAFNPPK